MLVVDLANEIFIDESSPTNTSIAAISFWIRGQIGRINSLLCEDFSINNSLEVIDCNGDSFDINAVAIIKQLYRLYALQLQINNHMNLLLVDSLLSVEDTFGGGKFTRHNKNEIAKTLISMRKDEIQILNRLVSSYKINKSNPKQVAGDDTISAYYGEPLISLRTV